MKQFTSLVLAAIVAPVTGFAQIIVNDSWVDGGRDNGADLLDAAWWTSSASTGIEVAVGSLGLVTGTSGRGRATGIAAVGAAGGVGSTTG